MSWNYVRYSLPDRDTRCRNITHPKISEDRAWMIDYEQGAARMKAGAPYYVTLVRYLGHTQGTWELWNRSGYRVGVYQTYDDLAYHAVRHGYASYIENLWYARWYALNEYGDCYSTMYAAAVALSIAIYKANHPRHKLLE